jgi:hypothetical protein
MDTQPTVGSPLPRLLDRVRGVLRARHFSRRTEEAYVAWIRRFILFHGKRHPDGLGASEVAAYLSHLATRCQVSASTQNQAFSAILFLYRLCAPEHKRGYVVTPVMWRSGRNFLRVARQ